MTLEVLEAVTPSIEINTHIQWANLQIAEEIKDDQQCIHSLIYVGASTYSSRLILMVGYVHANFSGCIRDRY